MPPIFHFAGTGSNPDFFLAAIDNPDFQRIASRFFCSEAGSLCVFVEPKEECNFQIGLGRVLRINPTKPGPFRATGDALLYAGAQCFFVNPRMPPGDDAWRESIGRVLSEVALRFSLNSDVLTQRRSR
ncbi:MAG: hypothetical protein NW208_04140 [Bryobacter sp.]|nr:hypothetical protein [Bryobacter sp.]